MTSRYAAQWATTFGVRVAGLPATVLDQLADQRLRHALLATAGTAAELTARAAELSDRCHEAIGALSVPAAKMSEPAAEPSDPDAGLSDPDAGLSDPAAKPKLVALRRAVHQLRDPARLLADPLVTAALSPELAREIGDFGRATARHRAERARLPAVLADAERAVAERLRVISAEPRFGQGLAHASPTLYAVARRRAPGRKELIRLAVYAARAAVKTSPFSTFTAGGLGRYVPDGPALRWTATDDARSVVELDLSALTPLAAALTEPAEATVRVNPSARLVDGSVRFLGPAPSEELLSLPLTPPLRHCLRAAAARPTFAALTASLPVPPEEAAGYVRSLLAAGVLLTRPGPDFDEHGIDPLGRLAERAPALRPLRETLRAYESANGADRLALGPVLRERLTDLGIDGRPRDVVTEQSVIPGTVAEAGLPAWRDVLDDLAAACRLLAVFDHTLPFKLAVAAFVRDRFGTDAPVPFDRFYAELVRDGHEAMRLHPAAVAFDMNGLTATLAASPVPEVRHLAGLIAALRHALPDRARPARILDTAPPWLRPPGPVAVYAQYDAAGDQLVVNAVNSGFGRGRSQVRRLLRHVSEHEPLPVDVPLPADVPLPLPGGLGPRPADTAPPTYAEFDQTLATSLNQREPALDDRLDYPPPARLTVGVGGDGLPVLFDGGAAVRPVHGGLSYERQLPPVMALLVEAFGENPILLRPDQPLRHDASAGRGEGRVLHAPRLTLGRVVLRRAAWVAQTGTLPRRAPGQSDADFLLAVVAWLAEHEIPPRFFVSVLRMDAVAAGSAANDRARKPLYVDVGSPPLMLAFERLARDPGSAAVFYEVAPGPETAITDHKGLPRVTEYVIELNCRGRRGPHGDDGRNGQGGPGRRKGEGK
ncbi:lantibiotic dehydratase [Streptomyces varsoviensis]|uniref:lantibiotic dehydratase n=1 Tax=Streptomyces varsoviensis TaxID=67373 RepID=UPI003404ECD3